MKRLKSYKSLFESLTNFQNDKSYFDSSNTIEERYGYIDILQLGDFEDNLAYIEKTFLKIPKDEILDIITELENLGLQISEGHLSPILWKGESLNQKRITTSFSETLLYLETEDFYKMSSDSIFSKKSVKYMSSEALDYIFKTKSEMEIAQIMDHDAIREHFFNKIKEEAREFEALISDGWIPGLAISKIKQLKNWQQSPEKIDLLFSITERLEEFLDYQMVFFPKAEEPSIIFIERKYIKY